MSEKNAVALDERQKTVTQVFTKEQLDKMSIEDISKLIGDAGPGAKFSGTAVVRKANGEIRYDAGVNPADFE